MAASSVDWNRIWQRQMMKNILSEGNRDCVGYWNDERDAERYWREAQEHDFGRIGKTLKSLDISRSSRVLDIGAGPGVLTIPLAHRIKHVTAVEPSPGMMSVLQRKVRQFSLNNVRCIHKRWEEVDVEEDLSPPYDLVVASFALGMLDLASALEKMQRVAGRCVCIYWFAGEPSWDVHFRNLTTLLHGTDYHPMPGCDVLFNVLYQMKIYPCLLTFPYTQTRKFASLEEAVDHYAPKYRAADGRQKGLLRDYLREVLEAENGFYLMRHNATCAKIWWHTQTAEASLKRGATGRLRHLQQRANAAVSSIGERSPSLV